MIRRSDQSRHASTMRPAHPSSSKRDLLELPALTVVFSGSLGLLIVILELSAIIVPAITLALAGIVYGIVHLVRRLCGSQAEVSRGAGWTALFSKWATWLATLTGLLGIAFIIGLILSLVSTTAENQYLLVLGVIKANNHWIFIPPWLIAICVLSMVGSTAAIWFGGHRSLSGRVVYSILTLLGLICVLALSSAGFLSKIS
jgi:hypothetical protein